MKFNLSSLTYGQVIFTPSKRAPNNLLTICQPRIPSNVRFLQRTIFTEPRLQNVTYYMRLDTDSLIKEPLCYDPFEVMHTRKRAYGYRPHLNAADAALVRVRTLLHNYALEHPELARRMRKNQWVRPHENTEGEMIMLL